MRAKGSLVWRRAGLPALLALLVLLGISCSDDENVVTILTEPDAELDADIVDAVDTDDDGVVSRDAAEAAAEEAELEAELEAERAERERALAIQEAAYAALLADEAAVAVSFPGGELLIGDVLASIADSPITLMDDPQNPTHEEFVSRLTSMLQLRLASAALDELGFPVDVTVSDEEINAQVQEHLEGEFEEFAQRRSVEEDPNIERLATPHCVSALAVTSEAEANAAADRVRTGEPFGDVADEFNLPGLTQPDGAIGCGLPFDLGFVNEMVLALVELEPGELAVPIMLASSASPTGELWVVMRLDDLHLDQTDLTAIGPFAGRVLTGVMVEYEVSVDPGLGTWDPGTLRVSLPLLQ